MLRCFDSEKIQNVNKNVDPIRDLEIIETEMKLADLDSIEKRLDKKNKKNVSNEQNILLSEAQRIINGDGNIKELNHRFSSKELKISNLLSVKDRLFVCNVDEKSIPDGNQYTSKFNEKFDEKEIIIISADIENQINQLDEIEKKLSK